MLLSQRTDATALDTAVDMFDAQPTAVQRLVRHVLCQRELLAAGLLGRHEDLDLREREGQEAQILQQSAPGGQGRGRGLGKAFIMDAAAVGVAEKEDGEEGMGQQDIFHRVVLCLAALTPRLLSRVLGADNAHGFLIKNLPALATPQTCLGSQRSLRALPENSSR